MQFAEDAVGIDDQCIDRVAALGEDLGDLFGVREQRPQGFVPRRDGLGQSPHTVERRTDVVGRLAQGVGQHFHRLAQLLGVDRRGGVGEIAEGVGQLIGRDGAVEVDGGAVLESSRTGGTHAQVPCPERGGGGDLDGGVGAQDHRPVDRERDGHGVVVDVDVGHPPGVLARDLHGVAGVQTAGVDESRPVGRAAVEERQGADVQGAEHEHDEHDRADDADTHGIHLAELGHAGAHLPVVCPNSGEVTLFPDRSLISMSMPHR